MRVVFFWFFCFYYYYYYYHYYYFFQFFSYSKDDFSDKLETHQCYLDSGVIFWKGGRGLVAYTYF